MPLHFITCLRISPFTSCWPLWALLLVCWMHAAAYDMAISCIWVSLIFMLCFIISAKWTEWNWQILCFHFCVFVCLCTLSPVGLNGWNDVLFAEKCIWLVHEKLRIFPNRQYIVENFILLAFWWYSQVQDRSGGWGEMYKNVTPFPMFWQAVMWDEVITLCCHIDNNHKYAMRLSGQRWNLKFLSGCRQCNLADICTFWVPSSYLQFC